MADGLGDIFVGLDDFRKFSADSFLQNANRLIGDVWTQHTIDNIPQMAGDIWTQHVTNQLPNLTSMLAPPPPPQTAPAAPPDPFAPITSPSTTPTTPTAPAPVPGVDSGIPPPSTPPAPAAGVPDQQQGGSLADIVRQAAIRHGIDPDVALRVAQSEGGLSNAAQPGDSGSSFGPFQLHYGNVAAGGNAVAGMGDEFTRRTGLDARDPANVAQAIDFALAHAAQAGWGAFHGAARVGIGAMEGIGQTAGQAAQQAASGAGQAVQSVASTVGGAAQQAADYVFPVVGYAGDVKTHWGEVLGGSDLFAPRGTPVVAMRGGKVLEAGFNSVGGNSVLIQGDDGNQYYYAHFNDAPSVKVGQTVGEGTYLGPVGDTGDAKGTGTHLHIGIGPSILLGADKYGGTGGDFDAVGLLRAALTGEKAQPATGPAAGPMAVAPPTDTSPTYMSTLQQAAPAPPQPPKSIWDQLGSGISDVFKNVFGGGGSPSTPPPPPEGGGFGAVPPGGQNPLDQIGQGISNAASSVFGGLGQAAQRGQQNLAARGVQLDQPGTPTLPDTPILSQSRGLAGAGIQLDQPGSPVLPPTLPDLLDTAANNVPQQIPVVAGALRGAAGMLSTPTPAEAAQTASAIEQKYGGGLQPKPGGGVAFRAPDYSNITPEDREALSNATFAVGGVAAPLGSEGELAQRAGNINLAKYPTEVQNVIQAAAPTIPESATRGVVPDAVVRDLAQKAGTTVQDVVAKWQPGQAQNAETVYALRDALANQGRNVLDAQQALRANPGSTDAQAALVQALTEHRSVQEVVEGTTAESGRALRVYRQPVTGEIAALQQLQTLAAKTGQSPADLAQQLASMDLSNPVHMGDIAKALNPPRLPPNEALPTGPQPGQFGMFGQELPLGGPRPTGTEAPLPAGPQPGQFQFGSELPVGGPRPTGTEPLARGPQPGQFQFGSELPLGGPAPTGREALGPAGRQPGQLGLGIGEQFQPDLMADVPGVTPQRVAPPETPAARPARETSPDPTGLRNFFGEAGTGKALGDSLVKHELAQAETRMAALRAKHPEITDEQAAQTPLGQQIERYRAEARARGIEAGTPPEPQPPESAVAAQASPGGFETPNVPTPAQTPEQADYLRRALTLKALREGTPLPDIPYQGPRGTNLQPNFDPSRAFDYDKLAQMRQDFESRQPQLDLNAPPKPNMVDKIISYTVNNMLSGIGTQVRNMAGNLVATVERPASTAAGGLLTGDVGMLRDASRDVAAMGSAFSEALQKGGRTLQTGIRSGQPEQQATSIFAPQLRMLSAGDEFYRTMNTAGGQATEMSRLLREHPDLSFEEVAAKYQGRLVAAGEDAAARSVYEKGGIGWGDQIAELRTRLLHSDKPAEKTLGLILNATVPFSKVPDTILTLGVGRLPVINEALGTYRTINLLRQGEVYAAKRTAGATALTTATNLAILAEALQGNITGDGPDDPTLQAQMMAARDQDGNALWRPHSVKLPGGRWIDYGFLGPMEMQLGAIANVVEGAREQGSSLNPQPAQMVINRLTKTVGNMWYLRGLSDILSAINGGQLATPNVANAIEAIGDRFVWQSGLLNEIRQLSDPTVRDPQNPLQREANRIPGLDQLVAPRYDPTTGQPLQRPQDLASLAIGGSPPGMSPGTGSAEILSRSDVAVSPAPKQITVGKFPIQLTHDEQQQYTQLRGQLIDQMVAPLARDNAFQTAPLYVREQVLRKMLDQASSAASKMMIGQIDPNSLNQRLQQSQQTITTNTPFLPEDTSSTGRVPALAR